MSDKRFRAFKRPVANLMAELIDSHGVRYRADRNCRHVYLYTGDQQVRPYKISSTRPAETSVHFLERWAERNVETWQKR